MYMVDVEIPPTESRQGEKFVGLCYPGSLVGRALGFNFNHGFAWSMNAVTPVHQRAGIRKSRNIERGSLNIRREVFERKQIYNSFYNPS